MLLEKISHLLILKLLFFNIEFIVCFILFIFWVFVVTLDTDSLSILFIFVFSKFRLLPTLCYYNN